MDVLLVFSKENIDVSRYECERLCNVIYKHHDNEYSLGSIEEFDATLFSRLAYLKSVYEVLAVVDDPVDVPSSFWSTYVKSPYLLSGNTDEYKRYFSLVWNALCMPSISLTNPVTRFFFFSYQNRYHLCVHRLSPVHDFESRKPHKRKLMTPVSLHPKLSRALVNMTGLKTGTLLDPFCGTGGFLIEGALCGLDCKGYDISSKMIYSSTVNLSELNLSAELVQQSALDCSISVDAMICDLPYGKSSKLSDEISVLYEDFLNMSYDHTPCLVVCFPDFVNYIEFLGNWKELFSFTVYLHKSLSKVCVVLEHPLV